MLAASPVADGLWALRIASVDVLLTAAAAIGCAAEPTGDSGPSAASIYTISVTSHTRAQLPACTAILEGAVAYVESPSSLWACGRGQWRPIPCTSMNVGAVAYASSNQELVACVNRQWTVVNLPPGPQGPAGPQGEAGAPGPQGAPGASAEQPFIQLVPIPPGPVCPSGGTEIVVSVSDVVTQTANVCNGTSETEVDGGSDASVDGSDAGHSGTHAIAVSVGGFSTCVITSDGGIECSGKNGLGELGNDSRTSSLVPVPVSVLTGGVTALSVGAHSACAISAEGRLECWGSNASGQLGIGSFGDLSEVPLPVSGLAGGVTAVSVGRDFACAVTGGGGVECWGFGGPSDSLVPVPVAGLTSGASGVSVGDYSTCAVTAGGGVECWGDNSYGELGNGSTTSSTVPVQSRVSRAA